MSAASSRATPLPTRRFFHCYNCNYSADTTTAASFTPSLACPSCHHQRSVVHRLTFTYPPTNTTTPPPPTTTFSYPPSNTTTATSSSTLSTPTSPPPATTFSYPPHPPTSATTHDPTTTSGAATDQRENGFSGESEGAHVEDFDHWFTSSRKKRTSKSFLESLPSIRITEADLKESSSCTICMDDFVFGASADKLPCKHLFHKSCIVEWLSRSNSCPLCRFKLPVEPRTPVTALQRRRSENNLDALRDNGGWTPLDVTRVTIIRTGGGGFSGSTGRGVGVGGIYNFDRGGSGSTTILDVVLDDDGDTLLIEDVQRDADGDVLMADA